MSSEAESARGGAPLPTLTRKATGLVREVSALDMILYNAASTSPIGLVLVFGLFALVLFPLANFYIAMIIAVVLGVFVWTTFALISAAIPRVGGDYTFNSRILHPWLGMAGSLCVLISSSLWTGIFCYFLIAQGLSPVFTVIGATANSSTLTSWGTYFSADHQNVCFIGGVIALAVMALLSSLGTRVVIRTMSILLLIAVAGFAVDILILLFTSHSSFVNTVNSVAGRNAYAKTVAAGSSQGIYPTHGFSTKNTIGAIYYAFTVTIFCFWGTFLAAEFKGAGRRKRQLSVMLGAGIGQGLLALVAIVIFLHTVGYDFFVSSLNGNYTGTGGGTIGQVGYGYFSALVTGNTFFVTVLGLTFLGWWLPSSYCNSSVVQRYFVSWALDGLLPRRLADVDEKRHTPIVAIVLTFVLSVGGVAWTAYSTTFFQVFAFGTMFAFFPIVLVGISGMVMKWRRPDLYKGTAAEWRLGGIEVLPISGAVCFLVGCFAIGMVLYFHTQLGITKYYSYAWGGPIVVFVVAAIWWFAAKALQARRNVDLTLSYKVIPPE
jgi:basic amino acid/polyamine antiporter, APA family